MPSQSGQQQLFSKVEDLPGAKLVDHLHHIFAGIKSRATTPSSSRHGSRNNSVAPSRAQSPTRETARSTNAKSSPAASSAPHTRSSSRAAKIFSEKGFYAF